MRGTLATDSGVVMCIFFEIFLPEMAIAVRAEGRSVYRGVGLKAPRRGNTMPLSDMRSASFKNGDVSYHTRSTNATGSRPRISDKDKTSAVLFGASVTLFQRRPITRCA